jgi:hypothetical protein
LRGIFGDFSGQTFAGASRVLSGVLTYLHEIVSHRGGFDHKHSSTVNLMERVITTVPAPHQDRDPGHWREMNSNSLGLWHRLTLVLPAMAPFVHGHWHGFSGSIYRCSALRLDNNFFHVFFYENHVLVAFEAAVRGLNPVVAVQLRSSPVLTTMAKVYVVSTKFWVRKITKRSIPVFCSEPPEESIYIDQNTRIKSKGTSANCLGP